MLTATFAAAGAGVPGVAFAASAGGGGRTSGLSPVFGGNQASAPISALADVCGSAVAVLGPGFAGCRGGVSVTGTSAGSSGGSVSPATSGNSPAGGGNQISAPVSVPADVCGNAAAVLGDSLAGCEGTASVHPGPLSSRGRAGRGNALAADSASGMGSVSFYFLALGALMAGAVALKMAGRHIRGDRIRGHKA